MAQTANGMNVILRVDASQNIGSGHLMRCLTLAEALRERGAKVQFICRNHPGHLIELLTQRSLAVTTLPPPPQVQAGKGVDYAAWLGVPQTQDATETIGALPDHPIDWLIVDHYGIDQRWERDLRPHVQRLMVIDDLANRPHECDLLLDQNFGVGMESRYSELTPATCLTLQGPRFALLGPHYRARRKNLRAHTGSVQRVLVFLGGVDRHNVTGMAIEALSAPELLPLQVDVVVGSNNPQLASITASVNSRPNTTLHRSQPHLADLMAAADLAIGAGGATTWERLCLGLPSLVVSIAENQQPACQALQQAGLIEYAGNVGDLDAARMATILAQMLGDADPLIKMAAAGQALVDGRGVERVVETIEGGRRC